MVTEPTEMTLYASLLLDWCWAKVAEDGPALGRHLVPTGALT